MVFGIDLGTTNSLIGIGDTLLTGLVSSNVDVDTQKQVSRDVVGDSIVSSYKTNMSMSEQGQLSVNCSAIILQELARMAERRYGEVVKDVVISVPAYFSTSQREAVYKAAGIAGLDVKTLINEPTAAALYVCKDLKDLVVVYDLGGGTFDITIVDSRAGDYAVVATDGTVLGGDDLDRALVQRALDTLNVPLRFRKGKTIRELACKFRKAKEEIQKPGITEVFVDFEDSCGTSDKGFLLTEDVYKSVVREVFGKTITMTQSVIGRNLSVCEKPKMVLVGGSTNCPYLKELIQESINVEILDCDVNPDYVVAKGVALYAEMINKGIANKCVCDVTKRLCIEDSKGMSLTVIDANASIPCTNTITVSNSVAGDKLKLQLYQGDSVLATANEYIGTLEFEYGEWVEAHEGIVSVTVSVGSDGVISLSAVDVLCDESFRQQIALTAR